MILKKFRAGKIEWEQRKKGENDAIILPSQKLQNWKMFRIRAKTDDC